MTYKLSTGTKVTLNHHRVKSVVSECADYVTVKWLKACGRCGGSGLYSHYHGECYGCGGTGHKGLVKRRLYTEAGYAKFEAAKAKKAEAKAAKLEAKRAAVKADNRELVGAEVWDAVAEWYADGGETGTKNDRTLMDMFGKACNWPMSKAAAEHLARCWANKLKWAAENAERDAHAEDVTEGRYVVVGKVTSVKERDTHFGTVYKMLVDCGTFRVYGSVPKSLGNAMAVAGRTVRFTGTFTAKEKGFGFFSRPAKAEFVEAATAA